MPLTGKGNSSGSANKSAHLQRSFLLFVSASLFEKRKNPHKYVLTGVESDLTDEVSLLCCPTGEASNACCTLFGLVVILRVLVPRPSSSGFLG